MGGWQLVHKAQDLETIYKFHRLLEVAPGGTVSVWSAGMQLLCQHSFGTKRAKSRRCFVNSFFFCLDSGTAHEPPSTLVMMGLQWFVAREMVTKLLDNSGKVSCCPKLCVPSHIYLIIR